MVNEWIGTIGVLLGAITTGIFSIIIRKNQNIEEREKLLLESNIVLNKEKIDKILTSKEELYSLLQNLHSGFSITQNYRMEKLDNSFKEYDMHYEKMVQVVLRAELLSHLYFPEVLDEVKNVGRLTNLMWGQQQSYFGYAKEKNQNRQEILNNIVQDSKEIQKECSLIMNKLGSMNIYS